MLFAKRWAGKGITFYLSSSMMLIARRPFQNVTIANDRLHVHKLYYAAIDELRISMWWMARDIEKEEIERWRRKGLAYVSFCMQTMTRANSCWPGINIYLPSMHSNGPNPSNSVQALSSSFIPNWKELMIWLGNLPTYSIVRLTKTLRDCTSPDGTKRLREWAGVVLRRYRNIPKPLQHNAELL